MNPKTGEYILDDRIVTSSGKMMLLDRLLAKLFATGHKVLVYSQFTTQLDIIEDWAVEWKGWKICRIDGRTPQEDRRSRKIVCLLILVPITDIVLSLHLNRTQGFQREEGKER